VLRAAELHAEVVIKGSKVDGVYDSDPNENPHAKMFTELTFDEALHRNLRVMDRTAFALAAEQEIPIIVLNIMKSGNLIERNYPELWKLWITTPEELHIKGGEPLDNVQQRAYNTLVKLIKNHTNGTIVIVTHRAVLKPLIARAIGIAKPYFWKIHIDTASYSILEYTDERGFYLTLLNQTKHLHEFIRELT